MPDVVIVGGGIVGCATAYYLRQRGVAATVVEQCRVASHSSGKAGGFLARGWCHGSHVDHLAKLSFGLHEELMETASAAGRDLGYRYVNATTADGEEIGDAAGCAQVNPKALTEFLAEAAGEVVIGQVVGVKAAPGRGGARTITAVVLADGRELPCGKAAFCLGSWAAKLAGWLERPDLPQDTHDGGHVHVVVKDCGMAPTAIFADGFEVYPRPQGEVYICAEKLEGYGDIPDNPDDLQPHPGDAERLLRRAGELCPALRGAAPASAGLCCLPVYNQRKFGPTICAAPGTANAYMACGHTCWGILNGPGTGKLMADLLVEGRSPWPHLDQFGL